MNNFGLTPLNDNPPSHTPKDRNVLAERENYRAFQDLPPGYGSGRIYKSQIQCQKCGREVEKTEQTGLNAGRRIIICAFFCHNDYGEIRICEDQLSTDMVFEVFDGAPRLRGERPALPEKAERPECIDVEAEVVKPSRLTSGLE